MCNMVLFEAQCIRGGLAWDAWWLGKCHGLIAWVACGGASRSGGRSLGGSGRGRRARGET